MQSNVPHIYAAGDVAGHYQLAHTAFREGEIAAENALGHDSAMDYRSTPRCVYADPEVAAVGLTEAEARTRFGDAVAVGTMPYAAIARAAMYGDRTGFVKSICETKYGELVGMVAVGTQATELINAGVVGIEAEATIETIGDAITAHPTLAEAVKESALMALGRPIHMPAPKRRARAAAAS
jgi:dihydrolipoamide dehydrogenase